MKIKKGDEVIVTTGKDKGKRGTVLAIRVETNGKARALVSGVNLIKKHVKANPHANETGGIREKEGFIDVSNIKLYNANTNKGERVGIKILEDGKKVRYFVKSGDLVLETK
ncbi:MAG: 50S ribosomal protein L24 [Gammaproteobacteria bacterium]|nr:50S ribosomal protein L24 [Gammaproteobacteria bacterium]